MWDAAEELMAAYATASPAEQGAAAALVDSDVWGEGLLERVRALWLELRAARAAGTATPDFMREWCEQRRQLGVEAVQKLTPEQVAVCKRAWALVNP